MGNGFNGKVMAHPVGLFCRTGPLVGGPSRIHSDKLDGYDGVTTCVFTAISCGRCCTVLVQVGLKASAHAIFLAIYSYVLRYPFTSDKVYRRSTAHQEVNQGQRLTTLEGVGRHAFGSLRCWAPSWKYPITQRGIYIVVPWVCAECLRNLRIHCSYMNICIKMDRPLAIPARLGLWCLPIDKLCSGHHSKILYRVLPTSPCSRVRVASTH